LSINEFARRLYPQFYISGKPQIIPDEVSIELSENVSLTPENFGAYINNKSFESLPLPDFISKQLLKPFKNVKTIIDDRMYVLSYLEYDRLSEDLKGIEDMISHTENPIEPALASWYSYCFIDSDKPSVNNKKMLRELLDKITYRRWVEGGTLFGITRYSFVCLRNPGKDCSYIKDYMDRHYKDMAELLLSMRAILLHFAKLSKDISDNLFHNPNDYTKEIEKLRKNYIKFINNYWFYEVTPQEQGIEMYQIGMNVMELEKMKEDLRKDIQELYDYSASERNKQENVLLNRIAVLGFILLPVSIVTGLMGMNFNSFTNCDRSVDVINKAHSFDLGIGALFIALLTFSYSVIGFLFLFKTTIKSKIFKAFLYVLAVLLLVAAIRTCFNYHHIFSFIIDSVRNILFP
jgi:Mg2+ and Co2+ transporter CorA